MLPYSSFLIPSFMDLQHFIDAFSSRIAASAHVKTVFGDPIPAQEKTIIPVGRVRYGFGGGGGQGKSAAEGEGLGFGAGVMAKPIGVIEVTPKGTVFIPITETRKRLLLLACGVFAGIVLGRSVFRKKDCPATATNFSL